MVTWENKVYLCWVNENGSCVSYGGSPVYFLVQSCPVQSFCYCIFAHESVTSGYWGGGGVKMWVGPCQLYCWYYDNSGVVLRISCGLRVRRLKASLQ